MTTFEAKYAGVCAACGEHFQPGRLVRYVGTDLITDDCEGPTDVRAMGPVEIAAARLAACSRCYLVHAGDCW